MIDVAVVHVFVFFASLASMLSCSGQGLVARAALELELVLSRLLVLKHSATVDVAVAATVAGAAGVDKMVRSAADDNDAVAVVAAAAIAVAVPAVVIAVAVAVSVAAWSSIKYHCFL